MSTSLKARRIRIDFQPIAQPPDEDPLVAADNPRASWMLSAAEGAGEAIGSWEVWNPHHLTAGEYSKLIAADAAWRATPTAEDPMTRLRSLLEASVPDMPKDLFDRLSPNQILSIEKKIWQQPNETRAAAAERKADAANPPVGAGSSASSSPAPLAASDGATSR